MSVQSWLMRSCSGNEAPGRQKGRTCVPSSSSAYHHDVLRVDPDRPFGLGAGVNSVYDLADSERLFGFDGGLASFEHRVDKVGGLQIPVLIFLPRKPGWFPVRQHAVLGTVDLEGIDIETALCAGERDTLAAVGDVQRPRHFDLHSFLTLKANECGGMIFDLEVLVIPLPPRVHVGPCAQPLRCDAADLDWAWVSGQPQRKVEQVDTVVDHRSAALHLLVCEHPPRRNATTT